MAAAKNATCYFRHTPVPALPPNETLKCTSAQCGLDQKLLSGCPIVKSYTWLPHDKSSSLAKTLRQQLQGRRLAIFGDSMARQVFSVLVGLLRDERSFLDFHSWNPARYRLWSTGATSIRDELDLFYRPLRCDPANCRAIQNVPWQRVQFEPEPAGTVADVDVSWIPMPLWRDVGDALRVATAAERASGRPFDRVLLFVPSAWQLDESDPTLPLGQIDRVPSSFWRAWAEWQQASAAHSRARYAALTMPVEHIENCDGGQNRTNQIFVNKYRMSPAVVERKCGPQKCCLGVATAGRNRLLGMPTTWRVVDFAAMMRQARPLAVVGGNWHYECILYLQGATNCAHRPLVRMGVISDCADQMHKHLKKYGVRLQWSPRENGDCAEEGNTMLWRHLARLSWVA